LNDPLRKLALRDGRYKPEAFQFLFESLDRAVQLAGREQCEGADRHVSGQELLAGMRHYASELFGPMAGQVWRSWGVRGSLDWGHIVFLLVDEKMLNRQDDDSIDDFRETFDFDRAFVDEYVPALPARLEARPPDA
jgi:uncharacterized repeat protein (TIGR04138 family)